jgi:hypothetical protein
MSCETSRTADKIQTNAENKKAKGANSSEEESAPFASFSRLSDQGSNLDFLESKSSVLPVTPSDNFPSVTVASVPFGCANVLGLFFKANFR